MFPVFIGDETQQMFMKTTLLLVLKCVMHSVVKVL